MLEVMSISGFYDSPTDQKTVHPQDAVSVRRGGFLHGTKVATISGWKPVELLTAGDPVRTLDNGFQEIRRVSKDFVSVPADEERQDFLPVQVPPRAAHNGRTVWLMPEQGMAVAASGGRMNKEDVVVVPARLLSGHFSFQSQSPAQGFEVTSLFFDRDEIVFLEGGFQAYCASCRIGALTGPSDETYAVLDDQYAEALVVSISNAGQLSALANPLGALPAPIPQKPVFPVRPPSGIRRPGRPGRPVASG